MHAILIYTLIVALVGPAVAIFVPLFLLLVLLIVIRLGGGPENANIFGSFVGHILGIWPPK